MASKKTPKKMKLMHLPSKTLATTLEHLARKVGAQGILDSSWISTHDLMKNGERVSCVEMKLYIKTTKEEEAGVKPV